MTVFVHLKTWKKFNEHNPFPLDISSYKVEATLIRWIGHDRRAAEFYVDCFDEYFEADAEWIEIHVSLILGDEYHLINKDFNDNLQEGTNAYNTSDISTIRCSLNSSENIDNGTENWETASSNDQGEDDLFSQDSVTHLVESDLSCHELEFNPFVEGGRNVSVTVSSNASDNQCDLLRFATKLPGEILEDLFKDQMILTIKSFNDGINQRKLVHIEDLQYGEFMILHSLKMLMNYAHLPKEELYWSKSMSYENLSSNMFQSMSFARYKQIKANLRYANYEYDHNSRDKIWKVRKLINLTKQKFNSITRYSSKYLVIDEGMARCFARTNPIRVNMPNKPIHTGFKFYFLVDSETKILLNFNVEDGCYKELNNAWSYGSSGKQVLDLLDVRKSSNNIVFTDRYYTSLELARELRSRGYALIGTLQKGRKPVNNLILFSNAKSSRPSSRFPRGSIKSSYIPDENIFEYGFMDNGQVLFLDTIYGPSNTATIERKLKGGEIISMNVPKAIAEYNKYKGAVDVFDQMRTGQYGYEMNGRTLKWTIRFYDCLFGMALTNAYNIHRYLHPGEMTREEFHFSVIKTWFNNGCLFQSAGMRSLFGISSHRQHTIAQHSPGSKNGRDRRRQRGKCRCCSTSVTRKSKSNMTTYYCTECNRFMHPQCFIDYHKK